MQVMRVVGLIQAHMGSTRLPGKVLMKIDRKPILGIMLDRLSECRKLDKIAVIVSGSPLDDPIVEYCKSRGVSYYRGSNHDVLDRYYRAAKYFKADVIVRLCSDCPLVYSELVDDSIRLLSYMPDLDIATNWMNSQPTGFPDGMDVTVLTMECLYKAWLEAEKSLDREHVTPYIYRHPEKFKLWISFAAKDFSKFKLSIDTQEDFDRVERIYWKLKEKGLFGHLYEFTEFMEEAT